MKNKKLMIKTINGRTFKVYRSNNNSEGVLYVREYSKDALTGKRKLECSFYCNDFVVSEDNYGGLRCNIIEWRK